MRDRSGLGVNSIAVVPSLAALLLCVFGRGWAKTLVECSYVPEVIVATVSPSCYVSWLWSDCSDHGRLNTTILREVCKDLPAEVTLPTEASMTDVQVVAAVVVVILSAMLTVTVAIILVRYKLRIKRSSLKRKLQKTVSFAVQVQAAKETLADKLPLPSPSSSIA